MEIKFCGGVKEVTGSCHVITIRGKKVALEVGMFQGHRHESYDKSKHPLVNPSELSAIVLSHAHVDHVGLLPLFYAKGFRGKVYATEATKDLAELILRDSAYIQEHNAEVWNKYHSAQNWINPLYTTEDAEDSLGLFEVRGLHEFFEVVPGMRVKFYKAGHILGSVQELIELEEGGVKKRVFFTGDLGRKELPIIDDPEYVPEADVLITESTYGNRLHKEFVEARKEFVEIIKKTYERGGKLIIPSFALERTQEVVYLLHEAMDAGEIPKISIYVDSPLATKVTKVFQKHMELYDEETKAAFISKDQDPFGFHKLRYTGSTQESKDLVASEGPYIVITASGMCEAGRILHHLRMTVEDEKNMIMVVGYMARGTLGRAIVEGQPQVKIMGKRYDLRAEVRVFNNFSAHADRNEILEHLEKTKGIKQVFVVHGEEEAADSLAMELRERGYGDVVVPGRGEEYTL